MRNLTHLDDRCFDDLSRVKISSRTPSYDLFSRFVRRVCRALSTLQGQLTVELACDDIVRYLAQVKSEAHSVDWRQGLPKEFTRMWMSNVP